MLSPGKPRNMTPVRAPWGQPPPMASGRGDEHPAPAQLFSCMQTPHQRDMHHFKRNRGCPPEHFGAWEPSQPGLELLPRSPQSPQSPQPPQSPQLPQSRQQSQGDSVVQVVDSAIPRTGVARSSLETRSGMHWVLRPGGLSRSAANETLQTSSVPAQKRKERSVAKHSDASSPAIASDGCAAPAVTKEGNTPPAWAKQKTKAGRDRKRLAVACTSCRRKKIRCSGEQPACKHCKNYKRPCVYRVNGPKEVFKFDHRVEQASVTSKVLLNRSPFQDHDHGHGPEPTSRKLQSTSPTEDPDLCIAANRSASAEPHNGFPSKKLQEYLFGLFFDHVHGHPCSIIHQNSSLEQLRSNTLPLVLVLSVCAVAARFATDAREERGLGTRPGGEEWAAQARRICDENRGEPNLTILISLILLCLDDLQDGHNERGWSLSGQAIRMAYALELHRDDSGKLQSNSQAYSPGFSDRELRRRVMWACVLVDRLSSLYLDRPAFIDENTIEVPLPVSDKIFQMDSTAQDKVPVATEPVETDESTSPGVPPCNLDHDFGSTVSMIRSLTTLCRALRLTRSLINRQKTPKGYSELRIIATESDSLLRQLPKELAWSEETAQKRLADGLLSHYILLHLSIPTTIILICHSVCHLANSNPFTTSNDPHLLRIAMEILSAARRISDVVCQVQRLQPEATTPFTGYCALLSSRVHSVFVASPDLRIKARASANCVSDLDCLHRLGQQWRPFCALFERGCHQPDFGRDASSDAAGEPQNVPVINQYATTIMALSFTAPSTERGWVPLNQAIHEHGTEHCALRALIVDCLSTKVDTYGGEHRGESVILGRSQGKINTAEPDQRQRPLGSEAAHFTQHPAFPPRQQNGDAMESLHEQSFKPIPPQCHVPNLTTRHEEGQPHPDRGSSSLSDPVPLILDDDPNPAVSFFDVDNGGWYDVNDGMGGSAADLSAWFLPYAHNTFQ